MFITIVPKGKTVVLKQHFWFQVKIDCLSSSPFDIYYYIYGRFEKLRQHFNAFLYEEHKNWIRVQKPIRRLQKKE